MKNFKNNNDDNLLPNFWETKVYAAIGKPDDNVLVYVSRCFFQK